MIEREEIEQIRDIDVDLIADRNKCRKTNPATGAPFRHSGDNGTRLGDKRDIAGSRHTGRKAGVESRGRDHHTETIGSDEPDAMGPCATFRGRGERT